MKRYIRSEKQNIVELDVTINFGYQTENVAATEYVNHPRSVKKASRLDAKKLVILNDIIETLLSIMASYGFRFIKQYQSKKSYSYYIWCNIDPEGKYNLPIVKINFRIADHLNEGLDKNTVEATRAYIKSIIVGDEEYTSPVEMITEFDNMCKELSQGNLNALYDHFN